MRIIAGTHRGKKLVEYYAPQTRPTTDRVKENVFNVLANYCEIKNARVLDLFAGTGAYGLECLSRGAKFVHFNDLDPVAIKVIKQNLGHIWPNCRVTQSDFRDALNGNYDLIFLDPPYDSPYGLQAIDQIKHGFIVFETDQEFTHPNLICHKKYGRAHLYLLAK